VRLQDILCDDVLGNRPESFIKFSIRVPQSGNIIYQGVKPYIGHEIVVKRERNAPGQAAFRPGNAQVFKGLPEERKNFVTVPFRTDVSGMTVNMVYQPLLIAAHPEKIVRLFDDRGFCLVVRAFAVYQFPFRVKPLTPETVKTLIFAEIDVTVFLDPVENRLHDLLVMGVRGPDKIVVADMQLRPEVPEKPADPIYILSWCLSGLFSGRNDFISMLIRAGEEKGLCTT
jgi:hypothetical protein